MKPVHAYASNRRLVDHLAPIWLALDPAERGRFFCSSREAWVRAGQLGVAEADLTRRLAVSAKTRDGARQPHWLVASYGDLRRIGGARRAVLVEHGAGQTYSEGGLPGHYSGGPGRQRVDLFLCPNQTVADRNRYVYPRATAVPVGCPKLDRWANLGPRPAGRPTVAFTFHWDALDVAPEARSAWPYHRDHIAELVGAATSTVDWLGHGHPLGWRTFQPWWQQLGVPTVDHLDDVFERADVLVCDNSSAMFEFATLGRPVVVLNAPWYRRDMHHGLRFWDCADVGLQVDEPAQLWPAIATTLLEDPQAVRRAEVVADLYANLGHATSAAVAAMRATLPA